ncbi:type III glutamate--ammonia ligase [Paracoccus zhejiangensis]|uniref:Type III glutamate--ammonia ligase n=1 Tax=Paracoccus zhejiangensis TaxID=1077935 RepID=A0A2H5EUQ9_9RHOB|nr:type III glutamate--ammonia ligase [Paracoccus zhejiangensis]AUH63029.1 type III glutamate--ammonia ligase [Paracoccus zhejiangensis]
MTSDLAAFATKNGIKYFMISYTDLFGGQRAKLVPAQAIDDMSRDGAGFAGFATWLDLTAAHPDMMAVPDPASVIQLPWKPEVAWVASNCVMEEKPVGQAPRNVLRKLVDEAAKEGLRVKTGVEPEFFLLTPEGDKIADPYDTAEKPCYDQQAVMRRYDVIAEVCDYMLDLGWEAYQNDHEDATGQFEMNWKYDDVLPTADKHSFFKFMIKSIAEKHGLRATFMPKPFKGLTGSGCHAHISVWDLEGKTNAFADPEKELGLSDRGRNFLGGIMKHAAALAAITNPTVNSYKRINAPRTSSGATWAPNTVTWTGNNRTHMVRVPGPGRFELRLPDGAANPYLMQAVILAAGLDGIRTKADPGPRSDVDMYTQGHTVTNGTKLPLNLLDALRDYDRDETLKSMMGTDFSSAYLKLKLQEWNNFTAHFSRWEHDNTLDI